MPIYEYSCKNCSSEFELIQKILDPPAKKCPSCGGKIEKKVSLSSFQLKGTGWYATDYAKKGKEMKTTEEKKTENKKGEEKKESPPKTKEDKKNTSETPKARTSSAA